MTPTELWEKLNANGYRDANRTELFTDLCETYGVPSGEPFGMMMCKLAWNYGHSGGYIDVIRIFEDLVPLWNAARVLTTLAFQEGYAEGSVYAQHSPHVEQ